MTIRKKLYPSNLGEIVGKAADKLGFDYQHIKMGRFPMKWYETYGLYSVDYIFDRFTPRNILAKMLKLLVMSVYLVTYVFVVGLWLTILGKVVDSVLGIFRSKPENPRKKN
jgi:hypothetical protein